MTEGTATADVARALREEARRTNERRLLVLHGTREACDEAAAAALEAADPQNVTTVGERGLDLPTDPGHSTDLDQSAEHLPLDRADALLGTTHDAVVLDCHDACRPNAVGRAVGSVDGGGLLLLLAPSLDVWPDTRDGFDEGLAVPPFDLGDVAGNFRARLVRTLRAHPGVAIVNADTGCVERDGLTDPAPRRPPEPPAVPDADERTFPRAAYEACLTADQVETVRTLEALSEPGNAVVVEADRGRGKSSAAGLAAGALIAEGRDVLVTAPGYHNAAEVFDRTRELLDALDVAFDWDADAHRLSAETTEFTAETTGETTMWFERPPLAAEFATADPECAETPDAIVVDEAAALPVRLLETFLPADESDETTGAGTPIAFTTTVHGYEGAGRGFSVRFRDRLAESTLAVRDVSMTRPIRYAAGDPVEVWAFRALGLDARSAVEPVVADATPNAVEYAALDPAELANATGEDRPRENRLRETFGLLVAAHYRTEPNDLARLLDAPNVRVRALLFDGHVVSVALLAREGGLRQERRRRMYEGERVRGNMLPDVLTSQLRDPDAAAPVGLRVLRIATHPAVRSRGLGSGLLDRIEAEFDGTNGRVPRETTSGASDGATDSGNAVDTVDWLGVGYGATPRLLHFWAHNGYRTVHLSTARNERSGEYSALMLRPLTDRGRDLHDRSAAWFGGRIGSVLADALDDADPDVVRAALGSAVPGTATVTSADADAAVDSPDSLDPLDPLDPLALDERDWRLVTSAAYGPGLYDVAPRPFRRLALRYLVGKSQERRSDRDGSAPATLDARAERLLVRKVLQARPWDEVARDLDYHSRRECMRALGAAYRPLVETYGTDVAREEADRYG